MPVAQILGLTVREGGEVTDLAFRSGSLVPPVLSHGQRAKEAVVLECPGNPQTVKPVRLQPSDRLSFEEDRAWEGR